MKPERCRVGEGLLPERSVGVKPEEQRRPKLMVNTRLATADHDRQGQATHRHYKSHTVVEFTSGKSMHNRHS